MRMSHNPLFSCIKPTKKHSYNLQTDQPPSSRLNSEHGIYRSLSGMSNRKLPSRSGESSSDKGNGQPSSPAAKRRKMGEEMEEWDDDDDFQLTQKDMETMDVIASQALTSHHGHTDPGPTRPSPFYPPQPVKANSAPVTLHQHSTPMGRYGRVEAANISAVLHTSASGSSSSTLPESTSSSVYSRTSFSIKSDSSMEIPLGQMVKRKSSTSSHESSVSAESLSTSLMKSQIMDSVKIDLERTRDQLQKCKDEMEKCKQRITNLEKENETLKEKMYATDGETAILRQNLKARDDEINALKQDKITRIGQQNKEQSEKEKKYQAELQKLKSQLEFKECERIELQEKCHQLEVRLADSGREHERSPVYSPKVTKVMERSPKAMSSFPTQETFMSQGSSQSVPTFGFASSVIKDVGVSAAQNKESAGDCGKSSRKFGLKLNKGEQCSVLLSVLMEGDFRGGLLYLLQDHAHSVDTHYFLFDRDRSQLLSPRPTRRLSDCKDMLKTSPEKGKRPIQKLVDPQNLAMASEGYQCLLRRQCPNRLIQNTPPSSALAITQGTSLHLSPPPSPSKLKLQSLPAHDMCGLMFLPLLSDYLRRYIDLIEHCIERRSASTPSGSTPSSSDQSIHSSSCDTSLESLTSSLELLMNEGAVFANTLESLGVETLCVLERLCLHCESVRTILCRRDDVSIGDITKSPRKRLKLGTGQRQADRSPDGSSDIPGYSMPQVLYDCNLLNKVLRLANPGRCSERNISEARKYSIHVIEKSMDVLLALADNITEDQAESLLPVLSNAVITNCLECHMTLSIVLRSLQLLTSMAKFNRVVSSLCVNQDGCVLQYLYDVCLSYTESLSPSDFKDFSSKVIHFLSTIIAIHKGGLTILLESHCRCSTQIVQCVIKLTHRVMVLYEEDKNSTTLEMIRDCLSLLHSFERSSPHYMDQHHKVQKEYVLLVCGLVQIFKGDPELYEQEMKILSDLWDFDQDDSELCLSDSDSDPPSMDME